MMTTKTGLTVGARGEDPGHLRRCYDILSATGLCQYSGERRGSRGSFLSGENLPLPGSCMVATWPLCMKHWHPQRAPYRVPTLVRQDVPVSFPPPRRAVWGGSRSGSPGGGRACRGRPTRVAPVGSEAGIPIPTSRGPSLSCRTGCNVAWGAFCAVERVGGVAGFRCAMWARHEHQEKGKEPFSTLAGGGFPWAFRGPFETT